MASQSSGLTFSIEETARLLEESFRTIEWAVARLPEQWEHSSPAGVAGFDEGSWSVAMNLAHLAVYEERLGLPMLAALASGGDGVAVVQTPREDAFIREAEELGSAPVAQIMQRLRAARQQEVALVRAFPPERFNVPATSLWGRTKRFGADLHSAGWVAAKSFQHTWEHGNALLRVVLFAPR